MNTSAVTHERGLKIAVAVAVGGGESLALRHRVAVTDRIRGREEIEGFAARDAL